METYTVYKHILPNNKIYIGITMKKPEYRWNNGNGYAHNKYFTNAIKKHGWENIKHEILYTNLTKEEAEQKEIELISFYKSNQQEYGYNIENGGNHQGKMSSNSRKKISESCKGRIISEETRKKISSTMKNKKVGNALISMKAVDVFDINNNYINTFESLSDAARSLNIKKQYISFCCNGKMKTCKGYKFKFNMLV